jgi:hypothetical protein
MLVALALAAGLLVIVVYFPFSVDLVLILMGLKTAPTRENHLRDCPLLPGSLYYEYRMSWDRQKPVAVNVWLSPPEAVLPESLGAKVYFRDRGLVSLTLPLERVCDLSNLPEVIQVHSEATPSNSGG